MTATTLPTAPTAADVMLIYIDHAVATYGEDACYEVEHLYSDTPAGEIRALVNAVAHQQWMRGEYLDDPLHASYLFHDETHATSFEWGEQQAERVDDEARELIRSFVGSHKPAAVSN